MKTNAKLSFCRIAMLLLLLFTSGWISAQQKTVTGTVSDNANKPVEGATVAVKGTKQRVLTNYNGKFSITVPSNNAVLVFSFTGKTPTEVKVGTESAINVTLPDDQNNNLDDVVVIGYGTTKRADLTGAVTSVKPKEITARPGTNPMESLQGRVPGLDITRTSGQPGAPLNIQLRGNRSITANGTPLFIINGLPGDYATLDPYDIESIEVLKDASSTAVYGSAGSNGVIIITTKSAKNGRLSIDFNTYYGFNGWSITPKMRAGDDYLQTKRDAYKYLWDATNLKWTTTGALWQSPADDSTIFGAQRWALYKQGQFVNWADVLLRKDAGTQNYSLGISGGNDKTKAYISFNYTTENGQYRGDSYKQYATTMRVDHQMQKWISVGANLQASYVYRDKAEDKLENLLTTDPLVQPYNTDGTLNPTLGNNVYNLLLDYQPGVYGNVDNNLKLYINPYVEFKPIKGLSLLSRIGTQLVYSNTYRFDGIGSVQYTYNNANIAKAQVNQNRGTGYTWENILHYNHKFGDHDFTFTGVSSWYSTENLNTQMNQSNIPSNNFAWYKFTGDVNTTAITSYTMQKTFGFLARINYSFKDKYLLSASVRRDGSSVLYVTNQWDNFPAASAGWKISEENFMAGTKNWLNNLKLRAGWGITGTAKLDPYSSQSILQSINMSLGGVLTPIYRNSQALTNPALGWEKSNNTNIGLDASMFKNRIDMSLDYYFTTTNGVIYAVQSPAIYGTYTPGAYYNTNLNIAQTYNKGFEVALNTRNIVTKSFQWTSSTAFSTNKEKILKLTGGVANNITNAANTAYTLSIGQPLNSFYNYKLNGIWQIGQEADAAVFGKKPGDPNVNVPGMTQLETGVYMKTAADGTKTYYYSNLANAQKYNPALTAASATYTNSANDYQILGHNSPSWSLGFQNTFTYKNIDLTVYCYFRYGQTINYVMPGWYQPNAFATNASPSRTFPVAFNYWTPTNPSNDFPMMYYNYSASSTNFSGISGLNYVDGSFFKIKNITLGYTLPASLSKKASIQRLRLYGTFTNALIIAKSHLIKDYDPEMNGSLAYPLTKQAVVGLNVTF